MATAGGTLDLDNVVQHHPRGQQGGQRMPAGAVAMGQAIGLVPFPDRFVNAGKLPLTLGS